MFILKIPTIEKYDEVKNEFILTNSCEVYLEHSLLSVSKWESKWHIPFLSDRESTNEQILSYIQCMVVSGDLDIEDLTEEQLLNIKKYIDDSYSATIIPSTLKKSGSKEIITSEIIYYWMVSLSIPFVCETWHLNRLINLIMTCNIKNSPNKKMGRQEIASRNREMNEARKQSMNTKG
jgi:hypothetical protein